MTDLPDNAPAPRLCVISKWADFEGYGFNLHAEKSKPGQFIGKVDSGSPADAAGLKEGDRIIEVNGVNIGNENHKQVVTRIKAVANETKLLVVDAGADKWYTDKKEVVRGSQGNVIVLTSSRTPASRDPQPAASASASPTTTTTVVNGNHKQRNQEDNQSVSSRASSSTASEASNSAQSPASSSSTPPPPFKHQTSLPASASPPVSASASPSPSPSAATQRPASMPPATTAKNNYNSSGLNLNMSVAEMRAHLASKKKFDPRNDQLDVKKKYEIIQNM